MRSVRRTGGCRAQGLSCEAACADPVPPWGAGGVGGLARWPRWVLVPPTLPTRWPALGSALPPWPVQLWGHHGGQMLALEGTPRGAVLSLVHSPPSLVEKQRDGTPQGPPRRTTVPPAHLSLAKGPTVCSGKGGVSARRGRKGKCSWDLRVCWGSVPPVCQEGPSALLLPQPWSHTFRSHQAHTPQVKAASLLPALHPTHTASREALASTLTLPGDWQLPDHARARVTNRTSGWPPRMREAV